MTRPALPDSRQEIWAEALAFSGGDGQVHHLAAVADLARAAVETVNHRFRQFLSLIHI